MLLGIQSFHEIFTFTLQNTTKGHLPSLNCPTVEATGALNIHYPFKQKYERNCLKRKQSYN